VLVTVADFFTEVFKQSFLPSEAGSTPTASRSTKRANGKGAASTRVSRFVRATFACTENYLHCRTSRPIKMPPETKHFSAPLRRRPRRARSARLAQEAQIARKFVRDGLTIPARRQGRRSARLVDVGNFASDREKAPLGGVALRAGWQESAQPP
jgi:hypothetical protein